MSLMKTTLFAVSALALLTLIGAPIAYAGCCSMDMDDDDMQGMERGSSVRTDGMAQHEDRYSEAGPARTEIGREAVCPVDGMKVRVTEDTPATEFRGKTFYFCNEKDQHEFLRRPERYARK